MRAWNVAVASLAEHHDRLAGGTGLAQPTVDPPGVGEVLEKALTGGRLQGLHTDLDATTPVPGPLLKTGRPLGVAGVIHVPDSQRQGGERLEVLLAQHLLPAEVGGLAQLGQLRQGSEVIEDGPLGVGGSGAVQVGEERRLPVGVVDLSSAVPESVPGSVAIAGRREGSVSHQASQDHLPLEVRQVVRDRLQHPVPDPQLPRLPPAPRGADLVIGRARELGPSVAPGPSHGDLEELVGHAVVEPVDHLLRHDGAHLWVIGEHLDRQSLVDDLADLLLGAVGQGHPGAIGEAAEHHTDLLP